MVSKSETEAGKSENSDDTLSDSTLLAEHLKSTKAWRALADWKRNLEKYRVACGQLQTKIIETMADTTGLTPAVQVKGNVTAPFLEPKSLATCSTAL